MEAVVGSAPSGLVAGSPAGCPLCGGTEFEVQRRGCGDRLYWQAGSFDLSRCSSCGIVVTVPSPRGEEAAVYYPADYVSFVVPTRPRSGLARALRSLLRAPYRLRYGPVDRTSAPAHKGERVLDVGCGSGAYLQLMKERGWDVYGIEPSEGAAKAAVVTLGVPADNIFVGPAEQASWPANSFDLVTLSHVLEHLPEPRQTLADIHRWLRPGGRVRIWVPNIESAESKVFGKLWFGLDVPRHLVHYSSATVRRLVEGAGFEIERIVPEYQGSSLSGSLSHLGDELRHRHRHYRHSAPLYYATLPVASVLLGLGSCPSIDVTALKR